MIEKIKRINHADNMTKKVNFPLKTMYGRETMNALNNFPISGLKPDLSYVKSVVIIKKAAAIINYQLGLLDHSKSKAIIKACDEIINGNLANQFVVDPYQAGAGTSHNMNVNEVIGNRAAKISGLKIHPNDDVNLSQSTNDVIPTAIRITVQMLMPNFLINLKETQKLFSAKSKEFNRIIKSGRTHLADALPVTLGQEFASYAKTIENDIERIITAGRKLLKIGIGGTGVGTGINTHYKYPNLMIKELSLLTGLCLKSSGNLLESANNTADFLEISGSLRILAQSFVRIGNDLRLLSSGPLAGLAEINLPKVQAGSSIMPGKVNPSIVEMLAMVCFQVIGFDQAILLSSINGQLELNVWLPLISYNLTQQIHLLTNALDVFNQKCLKGIAPNAEMCRFWFERSVGVAAVLNPYLGYDQVADLVSEALLKNKSLKLLIMEKKLLPEKKIDEIFSYENLTKPNLK